MTEPEPQAQPESMLVEKGELLPGAEQPAVAPEAVAPAADPTPEDAGRHEAPEPQDDGVMAEVVAEVEKYWPGHRRRKDV